MCTLDTLYATMAESAAVRRATVQARLADEPTRWHADRLSQLLDRISGWPVQDGRVLLQAAEGMQVRTSLDFERRELQRDLELLRNGEEALLDAVAAERPGFRCEIEILAARLREHFPGTRPAGDSPPIHTFITDRDGTVVNYCSRYRSSVQPAYNALFLSRFARVAAACSVVLSSAPIGDDGLLDVSTMPDGLFIYAGSKGREYRDQHGNSGRFEVAAAQQQVMDRFNAALQQLLNSQEFRVFTLIGSSLQFKFGQTTVARQDMEQSVPAELSQRLLQAVTDLVGQTDPQGEFLRIEDTGKDIEIILTLSADTNAKDFDKGDGIAYLEQELGLSLASGVNLVCGDTASDLPMAETVVRRSPRSLVLFVGADQQLQQAAERVCGNVHAVSCPDVLVWALNRYAKDCGAGWPIHETTDTEKKRGSPG